MMACHKLFHGSHLGTSLNIGLRNGLSSPRGQCGASQRSSSLYLLSMSASWCRVKVSRDFTSLSRKTCKNCISRVKNVNVRWTRRVFNAPAVRCSSIFSHTTSLTLAFGGPLSLFRRKEPVLDHAAEVLSNIPKEVFRSDVLIQRRKRRFFLIRVLIFLWNQLRFVIRLFRVMVTFGPLLVLYPLTYINHSVTVFWWKSLLFAMEHTGPTFIKLGQWASTRRDLFSAEFCELFYKLHSSTRRHSWFMTQRKLRKAFGKRWREIFVKIEKKPVGSGCIAQVHRAYMKADMIPDESLVEECLEDLDDTDHDEEVDFAEGLEIMGLGRLKDEVDDLIEEVQVVASKRKQIQSPAKPTLIPDSPPIPETKGSETDGMSQSSHSTEDGTGVTDAPPTAVGASDSSATTGISETAPAVSEDEQETLIPVAVKVLHPGIYRSFSRDLSILRLLARFVQFIIPSSRWLSLRETVEEFAELMTQQIDLRFEAECLEEFNQNFEDISYIRFPKPVRPYCKRDVIIETFEEGEPIANFLKEDADCPSGLKEQLAEFGVDALLKMIFIDNLIHGDLHPGNILVQNAADYVPPEESVNKLMLLDVCDTVIINIKPMEVPVRLVLLDAGIATMLSEKDRQNFSDVFTAIVIGEGEKVAELMLYHSRYNECTDIEGFKRELGGVVNKARQETIKLGKIQAGQLLAEVFSILNRYRVKMESNFASVLLAIFVLEGLGRSLDPELDLLERAKPTLLAS